jgi:hypothetical protein
MPEHKLDLLPTPSALPAKFRTSPAEILGAEVLDPYCHAVQSKRGGLCSETQEFSMSKKEPKTAKNISAQVAVEGAYDQPHG